jgi:imidazolonepropionase-like amidohydrolase
MTPIHFRSLRRILVPLLLCTTFLVSPGRSAVPDLVLRNATVIDGRGGPPVAGATVVIQDGRIAQVARGTVRTAPGAREIDLTGRWLIPGLIDAHVHVATDPTGRDANVRRTLADAFRGGVTTVRDMGGDAIALAELARWADSAEVAVPRVRFSALFGGPSFFGDPRTIASAHGGIPGELPWLRAVRDTTDLRASITSAKATGATGIKIYADLPPERIAAVTREAHRQHLTAWSHATVYPSLPRDAVEAGVNVLSHAMYLIWETQRPVPATYHEGRTALRALGSPVVDSIALGALFDRMRSRNVMLEPTLYVAEAQPSLQKILPFCRDVTGLAARRGVSIVAGTDDILGERDSTANLHRELELLVESGLSPLAALTAATRNGARALGLDQTYGTIEKGKVADLVVLDADPRIAIGNTRRVRMVIKGGRVYEFGAGAIDSPIGFPSR